MIKKIKLSLLAALTISLSNFIQAAGWTCDELPKECKKAVDKQAVYCPLLISGAKDCHANHFNANIPFYKGDIRAGLKNTKLYFPEAILTETLIPLFLPHEINRHSPLGKEVGDLQYSGTTFQIQLTKKYSVEECISDINSTVSIIDYYKKQYEIATSSKKINTDYTYEIEKLSENMKKLSEIRKVLQERSENFLHFADSTEGPKDRSSQLLKFAGKDQIKREVAEELIKSDNRRLALIGELRDKVVTLKSTAEIASTNFDDLYRKHRKSAAQQQALQKQSSKATNEHSKGNAIATTTSDLSKQESYPEGTWKLSKGTLICTSEEQYSIQSKLITAGELGLIDECGLANKNYKVVLLDHNMLSASKILIIENKMTVWTDVSFLEAGSKQK